MGTSLLLTSPPSGTASRGAGDRKPVAVRLRIGERLIDTHKPILMGILNITPDSFSDGGQLPSVALAVARARQLVEAGASILDLGAESTRPGSAGVDQATELGRVLPVLKALQEADLGAAVSIDTTKPGVARAALCHGATIVNDVSALGQPEMAAVIVEHDAAVILMHMRGTPRTMQEVPIVYDDLIGDIRDFLEDRLQRAIGAGISAERILLDPGIGFGKTVEHNLTLTSRLWELQSLGRPIVYGASRKRFLGALTQRPVNDRDRATAAACTAAVLAGANVLRVHDVAAIHDAVAVAAAIRDA